MALTESEKRRQEAHLSRRSRCYEIAKELAAILRSENQHYPELKIEALQMNYGEDAFVRFTGGPYLTAIDVKTERETGSSWRRNANGKIRITIGEYGERKSFPQKADGTFNFDKIVDEFKAMYSRCKHYQTAQAASQARYEREREMEALNEPVAKQIAKDFGTPYGMVTPSKKTDGNVVLKLEVDIPLETARILIAQLYYHNVLRKAK